MKKKRNIVYWLLPLGWMAIIFAFSAQPYEKQDIRPILGNTLDLTMLEPYLNWIHFTYAQSEVSVEALGIAGLLEFFIRKGAHFGVFFILMCFFIVAWIKSSSFKQHSIVLIALLLSVIYACLDEYHQGFTENRTPYIGDVVIDSAGAITAGFIFLCFSHWKTRRKS